MIMWRAEVRGGGVRTEVCAVDRVVRDASGAVQARGCFARVRGEAIRGGAGVEGAHHLPVDSDEGGSANVLGSGRPPGAIAGAEWFARSLAGHGCAGANVVLADRTYGRADSAL
ncbi:hypothetical protein Ae168Ps1_5924c [Pseudonocardia sp. Ae168_Ps1]|nr:hypothetical protein Ae168Ps1_5924c [Pseudonocardia sp. Ae168_Ps1]